MDRPTFLSVLGSSGILPFARKRPDERAFRPTNNEYLIASVVGDHYGSAPIFFYYDSANKKLRSPSYFSSNDTLRDKQISELVDATDATLTIKPLFFHGSRKTYSSNDWKEEFAIKLSVVQQGSATPLSWASNYLLIGGASKKYGVQSQPVSENNVLSGVADSAFAQVKIPGGTGQMQLDTVATLYNEPWVFKTLGEILKDVGVGASVLGKVNVALAEVPVAGLAMANSVLDMVNNALSSPGFQHLYDEGATVDIAATKSAGATIAGNTWFVRKFVHSPHTYVVVPNDQSKDFEALVNPNDSRRVEISPIGQITVPPLNGLPAVEDFDYLTIAAYAK